MKGLGFTGRAEDLETLREYRRGESDLVHRDGMWFLYAVCEVPEASLNEEPSGWLGVDLGIVNIATTSDGVRHAGRKVTGTGNVSRICGRSCGRRTPRARRRS